MRIEEAVSADVRILGLAGEFDAPEARELAERLDKTTPTGFVVLNLRNLRFASAAAIDCFIQAQAKARARGGDLVLSAPPAFFRTILGTLGLDGSFRIFPDDDEAIRYFRASGGRSPRPEPEAPERTLAAG